MTTPRQSSEGSDVISTVGSSTNLGSHDPPKHLHHDTKHQENFSGLVAQKHAAEEREEERREESKPEDRSFAYRKPGAGNLLKEFLGNQGIMSPGRTGASDSSGGQGSSLKTLRQGCGVKQSRTHRHRRNRRLKPMPEGRRNIEDFRAGNIPQIKSFRPDDRVHQQPSVNMPTSVRKASTRLGVISLVNGEMEDTSRTSSEESIAQSDRDENEDPAPSESEPHFQPICGTNSRNVTRSVSQVSSRSSRSISRVYSLSDGYSHPAVDNDRLQEPEDDEKAEEVSTAPGAEYTVKWDGHDDPDNPRNMKLARKWAAIVVLAIGSVFNGGIQLLPDRCDAGIVLFHPGTGIGATGVGTPIRVAKNIETMLVARFFTGISGSAFLSVAGGTVGDMFARHELGAPMMIYTASPFLGPELGPLRWIFYMLLIWSASVLIAIALFVPETYHPVLLRRKAIRLRRETGDERWRAPIERRERSVAQTVLRAQLLVHLWCLLAFSFSPGRYTDMFTGSLQSLAQRYSAWVYHRLGFNWASSLLAFLTVAMAPFPYLFFRYGKWIRKGNYIV
ncbi:MFS multidrug transporter [Histoplasma capsulatum H143]|uniref:MFS multidrug transporter n=1 Tax=Ajellomyces capsulatus (strain H143) TaxID=544712 RepID=C6HJE8_AJECH|nr:MFS multidrug transporter [Histoplasma capsulatum H143]